VHTVKNDLRHCNLLNERLRAGLEVDILRKAEEGFSDH
jgi:hypothetical protein